MVRTTIRELDLSCTLESRFKGSFLSLDDDYFFFSIRTSGFSVYPREISNGMLHVCMYTLEIIYDYFA